MNYAFAATRADHLVSPDEALPAELEMGLGARTLAPYVTARCQPRDCCCSTSASTLTPASIGAMAKRSIGETVIWRCSTAGG